MFCPPTNSDCGIIPSRFHVPVTGGWRPSSRAPGTIVLRVTLRGTPTSGYASPVTRRGTESPGGRRIPGRRRRSMDVRPPDRPDRAATVRTDQETIMSERSERVVRRRAWANAPAERSEVGA
ncbi:hypothetical protein GCM10018790_28630 [Kitasatospora xanthocidica]|nr:hypothetical protein GCM10018790_28630 [Kitasatospora xanthocidica]